MNRLARCVNLDWLEVAAYEPPTLPHHADYFRERHYVVHEREYGSKVWGEIFTIDGIDGMPFIEVRRNPKTPIMLKYECHIRFVNRWCYDDCAADIMSLFLTQHQYEFQRISRVDVCMDFERFDEGDRPADVMRRYMAGRYSKINQANVSAHGTDAWSGRVWNSVSWGSLTSDVGTKFYNKTLELYDPVRHVWGKPYIRQAWQNCGLVDNAALMTKKDDAGNEYTPEIWRVEFSIRSSVKRWFMINRNGDAKDHQSIRNTLEMYSSRERLLILFASLSQHYFHFKYVLKRYKFYEEGHTDGYAIRKDRCPDKVLFKWGKLEEVYTVGRDGVATSEPVDNALMRLLSLIKEYQNKTHDDKAKQACEVLIRHLQERYAALDQHRPSGGIDEKALRLALSAKLGGSSRDVAKLLSEIKAELRLNDATCPFF